ncbi:hypothetical protein [Chitinimonas sp.]|uniref:hypothetical protein n=1 Tax=Chitinimonas sp. TaxID=1934313 RepID=UPI002F933201
MTTAFVFHEPLQTFLQSSPARMQKRLPGPLPLGFPDAFRARLVQLAADPGVTDETFQRLYFDLVVCPQMHASMRRMYPNSQAGKDQPCGEAIFLDPAFSWSRHLDERLSRRWQECLLRHGEGAWLDESLALLSSFRVLLEHL